MTEIGMALSNRVAGTRYPGPVPQQSRIQSAVHPFKSEREVCGLAAARGGGQAGSGQHTPDRSTGDSSQKHSSIENASMCDELGLRSGASTWRKLDR